MGVRVVRSLLMARLVAISKRSACILHHTEDEARTQGLISLHYTYQWMFSSLVKC